MRFISKRAIKPNRMTRLFSFPLAACAVLVLFSMGISCRRDAGFPSVVVDGPAPTADFSYAADPSDALHITFTNLSKEATSYYWQFGDGVSSTDASPSHTYAASARYQVTLTTRSAAGYARDTTLEVVAAAPATASFSSIASGPYVTFTNTSAGAESVVWEFGDGTDTSHALNPSHLYPAAGSYTVKLTVYGIAGDTVIRQQALDVTTELLSGGACESGDKSYWKEWSQQTGIPPVFGYTGDTPAGGSGGCLAFPSFTAPAGGSVNELIYQPVYVIQGKKYRFSALVKVPGGGSQCYLQFYLSTDPNNWVENNGQPFTNLFVSLNAWHGWGTTNNTADVNGEIVGVSTYGPYAATGGVYTATATGTLYLGLQVGSWEGYSNGMFLVDDIRFEQLP
jgi:PKD repeat protein